MTRSRTAFVLATGASPARADEHTATVPVVHAIPDTPVDVCANGEQLVDDFQPGTLTDPLELPGGSYDLAVFPADAPDGSGDPLLSADGVDMPAGADATVVAHLTEAGPPALTPFVNDTPAGQDRVTVRHTAAAPAVDVRAGGQVLVPGLTNPNGESLTVPAGGATRWRVVSREVVEKQTLPLDRLLARSGPPRLVLVTCGGLFLPAVGGYRDDVVVAAEPVR